MPNPSAKLPITTRDHFVIAKALTYAVAFIQSLPEEDRETSDMLEMSAFLRLIDQAALIHLVFDVERHTGKIADVFSHYPSLQSSFCEAYAAHKKSVRAMMLKYNCNGVDFIGEDDDSGVGAPAVAP